MLPPSPDPTAQGTFAQTPFPHLLVYALERALTGTFEFSLGSRSGDSADEQSVATMQVIQGVPAKLRTTDGVYYLGDVMAELGLVSLEAVRASQARMTESPRLQGQILRELGATDDAGIEAGVRAQLDRKVEYIFGLSPDVIFSYYEGVDTLQRYGGTPTPIDPLPALWRGVRQHPAWDHIEATLRRVDGAAVRIKANASLDRFKFTALEISALERLRTRATRVADFASTSVVEADVAQLLVYVLIITKQVDLIGNPSASLVPDAENSQVFARVKIQTRPFQRAPLVVEEAAPRNASDGRLASPMPQPIPLSIPAASPSTDAVSLANPSALDHKSLKQKIIGRATAISAQNYFEMLGVETDASPETIQEAFFGLAKVWHPDRLPAALVDAKDACSKVFTHLTEANATLCDKERRAEYMRLLKDGGATPDDQAMIHAILDASTEFQKAEVFLKRNDTGQAMVHASKALALDPKQADYLAMVTWLQALKPDALGRAPTLEKIAVFDRCIESNANSERAYFWRGMLYKRIAETAKSVRDFKKASQLNPRNLDALREVRLFNLRGGQSSPPPERAPSAGGAAPASNRQPSLAPPQPEGRGGIFGKLFKK